MREQVLVPPIVVSSRRSLPQRAPFSFARRYLSPSRPRLSSRLSFRFSFRRRPALRLVVVLSWFPSRLSSKRSVRRRPRFPSYPPPSLRRHLIRRLAASCAVSFARRSSFPFRSRSVLRPVSRFVPHVVGSSALPVSSTRWAGRFLFSFDGERTSKGAGEAAGGRWIGQSGRGARDVASMRWGVGKQAGGNVGYADTRTPRSPIRRAGRGGV